MSTNNDNIMMTVGSQSTQWKMQIDKIPKRARSIKTIKRVRFILHDLIVVGRKRKYKEILGFRRFRQHINLYHRLFCCYQRQKERRLNLISQFRQMKLHNTKCQ
jgi:hypothetical protein